MNRKLLEIIALVWLVFFCVIYYLVRPSFIAVIPLALLILINIYKVKLSLSIHLGKLLIMGLLGVILISLLYGQADGQLKHFGLSFFLKQVTFSWIKAIFCLVFINLTSYTIGSYFLKLFKFDHENLLAKILLSLTLGYSSLISLSLSLAMFGILRLEILLLISLIILLLGRKGIISISKTILSAKIQSNDKLFVLLFISAFIVLISHSALTLRGIPIEFDSLFSYANTAKNLAVSGELPSYWAHSFGFELLTSLTYLIAGGIGSTSFNAHFSLLAVLALYLLARRFSSEKFARLSSLFLYSTFTISSLTYFDDKVDLALLFFSLISMYLFSLWLEQKKNKHLLLCGLITGVSFTIKYTSIFLIIGLFAGVLTQILRNKPNRANLKLLILWGAFIILPIIPWFSIHLYTSPPQTLNWNEIKSALLSNTIDRSSQYLNLQDKNQIQECISEISQLSYKNMFDPKNTVDHLLRPIRLLALTDESAKGKRATLDPLFVGLFVLVILSIFRKKSLRANALFLITFIYFLSWYLIRPEILWYALPGFALLTIIQFSALENTISKSRIKKVILYIITASVLLHNLYYIVFNPSYFLLPNSYEWKLKAEKFILYDLIKASDFVNEKLDLNNQQKALLTSIKPGGFLVPPPYFINNNIKTTVTDRYSQLSFLSYNPDSPTKLLNQLESWDVSSLLVRTTSNEAANISRTEEKSESKVYFDVVKLLFIWWQHPKVPWLHLTSGLCYERAGKNLNSFLQNHGELVYNNANFSVYTIKYPEELAN